MEDQKRSPVYRIIILVTFLLMVVINALAMLLPINGMTTADISDSYPNLFAPAGITFSIWSIIYLFLAAHTAYQILFFSKNRDADTTFLLRRIGILFIATSILNAAWIITWHYLLIPLSTLLIIAMLVCLIFISLLLRKKNLSVTEIILIKMPFSLYFGWITVAVIANITILLVALEWSAFGLSASFWTVLILLVGTAIATATMLINKDIIYGLPIIWAYAGIVIKHLDASGHNRAYPTVTVVAAICAGLILLACIYVAILSKLPTKKQNDTFPEISESKKNKTKSKLNAK